MMVLKRLLVLVFLSVLLGAPSLVLAALPQVPGRPAMAGVTGGGNTTALPLPAGNGVSSSEYVLGTGDKIKLTVYGETDLSGEYEVGSTGVVALPLIGDIAASGHTITHFEKAVREKLSEGYLRDPRVSAQVINYRPFFILGEVTKPGSYPFVNGMTVINAIALAGGYTYRADKGGMTMTRASDPNKKDAPVAEEAPVMPGDVIRVPERFF